MSEQSKCGCGHGDVVWLADGTKSCTNTIERFRVIHGALPANWLPLRYIPQSQEEQSQPDDECWYCDGTGEIETDNNGPIGACPLCGGTGQLQLR